MNCPECEQLLDAYLDGQLAGTLRLEFDAHRLRCPRCQQTLAMLETVGSVLATDRAAPSLPADFTDRVMQAVELPAAPPRLIRFPASRAALLTAAVVQAVAVLTFAVVWHNSPPPAAAPANLGSVSANVDAGTVADLNGESDYRLLAAGVEDQVRGVQAAGTRFTTDLFNLARYLDITVPEDLARETARAAGVNPWQYLWDFLLPPPVDDEPGAAESTDEIHSI